MNKKSYLLLLVTVLSVHDAQAQFSFGARAGFTMTDVNQDFSKMKPGFQVGVVGDFTVAPILSIQPAVLFATQGWTYKSDPHEVTISMNYIQVPVHLQVKIDVNGPKLLVQAGPYLSYGLGGKFKTKYDTQSFKMGRDESDYKAIDYGLSGGAGIQFGNIQIGIGYLLGIENINNRTFWKEKNTGLSLALTYLF